LAYLGDVGYTFLLWLNKVYNGYRAWQGLPYYSLSQKIKHRVKMAVNYISDFEEKLTELARSRNCDGIICGHIHQPAIRDIDGITYMNSGDWVESMSALVEDFDGIWSLLYYNESNHASDENEELMVSDFFGRKERVVAFTGKSDAAVPGGGFQKII
jgi:UDP-2,3-diacylglucosamine pyrophosphatase LpxH